MILWQLATNFGGLGDTSGNFVGEGSFTFLVQGGGSGVLYVTNSGIAGSAFTEEGGTWTTETVPPKRTSVPMTAGAWTLYMTVQFTGGSTRVSNWMQQINGPIVETLN